MNELLLTYVVPVYNTEAYLLQCLQSIIDQGIDPHDYEVIVVDDGSPDNSRAIAEDFIARHHQVRLITQANAGLSAARNTGIANARGRYLHFVDSDDYLVPCTMQPLLRRAIDQKLDILFFNFRNVDTQGNPISDERALDYSSTTSMSGYNFLCSHAMTPYAWRYLLSRDYLLKTGFRFDPAIRICEDGPFMARILPNAHHVAYEDVVVYCYVKRGDSIMNNPDKEHLRRRLMGQVDAAASIEEAVNQFQVHTGQQIPANVTGMRNVYLYFALTKAFICGCVEEVLQYMKAAGLYPFPCVGPEANYRGVKWKIIHRLMMCPRLWALLSKFYRLIK